MKGLRLWLQFKPKGKKVTGTKKKDKIVSTGKGVWKKALTVKAGAGNDLINFKKSKYKNTIYGEAGKDTIYGGNDSLGTDTNYNTILSDNRYGNVIYAGNGVDTVDGEGNSYRQGDYIYAGVDGQGNNKIYGGKGNDSIDARYSYNATIDGGEGDDRILTAQNLNSITGGTGNDTIYMVNEASDVWTDDGDDLVISSGSSTNTYHIRNGEGNDSIVSSKSSDEKIVFEDMNFNTDDITATYDLENNQVVIYYNKVDGEYKNTVTLLHYFEVKGGTEVIEGYDEYDNPIYKYDEYGFYVKEGTDPLQAKTDSDIYSGLDTLVDRYGYTLSLRDILGGEQIVGAKPEDTIAFSDNFVLNEDSEYNWASYYMEGGNDTVTVSYDHESGVYIYGGSGNDSLVGSNSNEYLSGDYDDDTLYGKCGDDTLKGGRGDDAIFGGRFADTIFGGEGADTINSGTGNDVIFTGIHILEDTTMEDVLERANNMYWGSYFDKLEDAGETNNVVIGNSGSNTVYAIGENADITWSGSGDIHVFLANNTFINDTNVNSGANNLTLHSLSSWYTPAIFMNVVANKEYNAELGEDIVTGTLENNTMYISEYFDMYNWAYGYDTDSLSYGLITVMSGEKTFDRITNYNGYYIEKDTINNFVQEVAGWLTSDDRDYADVNAAFASGDNVDELRDMFYSFNNMGDNNSGWVNSNP